MLDYFDYRLAIDPTSGIVVPNARAKVYAISDTSFATPLTMTDQSGVPIPELVASPTGVFPQFKVVPEASQVFALTDSGIVTVLTSVLGMEQAALDAVAASASAALAAAGAASTSASNAATSAAEAEAAKNAAEAAAGGVSIPPGTAGKVLGFTTVPVWVNPPASGVTSVNGHAGAVELVAADIDDFAAGVTGIPGDSLAIAKLKLTELDERIRDVIGAALFEGVGIDIVVDDTGNKITIANTGAGAPTGTKPAYVVQAAASSPFWPVARPAGGTGVSYFVKGPEAAGNPSWFTDEDFRLVTG